LTRFDQCCHLHGERGVTTQSGVGD
jgi:hypothetical protein